MRASHIAPTVLALLAAAACGQSTAATPAGITGVVRVGPTCPAASKDHPCPPKPVSSERLRIRDAATNTVVKTVTSDAHGHFSADLAPGAYIVDPMNTGHYLRTSPVHVDVSAGKVVHVRILLDSGMR